jgi:serine protease Do
MTLSTGKLAVALTVSFLAISSLWSSVSYADEATERVLTKAVTFTVKIKRSIEFPFFDGERGSAFGSGFLVDKERGWIATNAHVATQNPSRIEVAFKGLGYQSAKLVYVDPYLDMAVLETAPKSFPKFATAAELECSLEPKIGSAVLAFGHPQYMEFSGSRGIISAIPYRSHKTWIQSDASISGGSSGGPFLDAETGKVIGISTSGFVNRNIGFSHLISPLCRILALLKQGKDPSPHNFPYLIDTDPDTEVGLNVVKVLSKYSSGARSAKLEIGDKILGFVDGAGATHQVKNFYELIERLRGSGSSIRLVVQRNETNKIIDLKISKHDLILKRIGIYFSGMVVAPLNRLGDKLLNPDLFLVVHDVKAKSPAHQSGVENYDRITLVDGKVIKTLPALCEHLQKKADTDEKVRIVVERHQNKKSGAFEAELIDIEVSELQQVGYQTNGKACRL